MINIDLKQLVGKMNPVLREALEGAAGLCVSHNQYNVEIEHWLLKLLENNDTDLLKLIDIHEVNSSHLHKQLIAAVDTFQSGSSRAPSLAPTIVDASKNAWMLASVEFSNAQMTSGHLLAAILLEDQLRRPLIESVPLMKSIPPEVLKANLNSVLGTTGESKRAMAQTTSGGEQESPEPGKFSKYPALDKFTVNLTQRAKDGEIDPVLGRDEEIRQCIDILTRRRQNNPILTGEAGVGKTAVVEGFALRVANNDVPAPLQGVEIRSLDLGLLQAGASVKGEFENRLKSVIEEVSASPTPIIMFIDEAHTMIGAGGKEGQGDAANLLKPALARGMLRTIAATTWAEYKKYFERDPALTRRFQIVKIEEPDEERAIDMMRAISVSLQLHHKVRVLNEAIEASVRLSHRYIPSRQLPDKSVSLLDTACARVALGQSTTPAVIEDTRRYIKQANQTIESLQRENAFHGTHQAQLCTLSERKNVLESKLAEQMEQWEKEKEINTKIRHLYDEIDKNFGNAEAEVINGEKRVELEQLFTQLEHLQGSSPLIQAHVNEQAVAEVVENWTGIPVGKMISDEVSTIQNLATKLEQRVIGQSHALQAISQAIQTSRAGLTDPRKPIGVFLMVGTSGVGKTETALALAELLYGGESNITTINMSEFKEEHKVSMLLGSPPGYVGFGEGGVLTEAARRKPYSVILLDEMEKAHPGVQDIFYNLFDKGTIKDGEGRDIDFKNTLIIMTSNAGEDAIRQIMGQVEEKPDPQVLLDSIRPALLQHFKPAFLGRTSLTVYYPLDDENLVKICAINMRKIEKRVQAHYGASFTYDEDVLIHIVARCHDSDTGARNIENILNRHLLPELASECLNKMALGEEISNIHVDTDKKGNFTYLLS